MLFTRYGSQVQIVQTCKLYSAAGALLVQAEVVSSGKAAPNNSEVVGQNVGATDPFIRGWIPVSHLISDQGPEDLIMQAQNAPETTPSNLGSLLAFYWPGLFGFLTTQDILSKTGIMAHAVQRFRPQGIFQQETARG